MNWKPVLGVFMASLCLAAHPVAVRQIDPDKGMKKQILFQSGYFGERRGRIAVERSTRPRERPPLPPWKPENLVQIGDTVKSEADGRFELLLLPGDYLRGLGAARLSLDLVTPNLLIVRLDAGRFIFERGCAQSVWTVFSTPNGAVFTNVDGVFRIDVFPDSTQVRSPRLGSAFVSRATTREAILESLSDSYRRAPMEARSLRPGMKAVARSDASLDITEDNTVADELDTWSAERADALARINLRQNEGIRDAARKVGKGVGPFYGVNPGVGYGYDTYFFPIFDSVTGEWKPGEIAWTTHDVRLVRADKTRRAAIGECLDPGTTIVTGPAGRVEVSLGQDMALRLAASSSVEFIGTALDRRALAVRSGHAHVVSRKAKRYPVTISLPGQTVVSMSEGDCRFYVASSGVTDIEVRAGKLTLVAGGPPVKIGKQRVARVENGSVAVKRQWEFEADLFDSWPLCAVAKPDFIRFGFWLYDEATGNHVHFPQFGRYESPYGKFFHNIGGS